MKLIRQGFALWAGLLLMVMTTAKATPPVNDIFENRIVLTGTNIDFTGNLDEAEYYTFDHPSPSPPRKGTLTNHYSLYDYSDIWWSWTAPFTGEAVISSFFRDYNGVAVYTGGNQTNLISVAGGFTSGYPGTGLNLCFAVTNGVEYQIAILSKPDYMYPYNSLTGNLAFHLTAYPGPVIVKQPESQTVRPGGSAFFRVLSRSITPSQFQWQHQGTNLPGETSRALLLHHVQTNEAGAYRVIISDTTGTNVSAEAALLVETARPANLTILGKGRDRIDLLAQGGIGQSYTVETSTDLQSWNDWPASSSLWKSNYQDQWFVTGNDGQLAFATDLGGNTRFFRASPLFPVNEVCLANLKYILFLKELLAIEKEEVYGSNVNHYELSPYMKAGETVFSLQCPEQPEEEYDYSIGALGTWPSCIRYGHSHGLLWE